MTWLLSQEQLLDGLINFLNFDDVLCNGNPDNLVNSLNKSIDCFEYIFFELYLLVINSIKSSSTSWLIIIFEFLLTINLLNPVNWFKSICKLPYFPSCVNLYDCLLIWWFTPVPTIEEEYDSNLSLNYFNSSCSLLIFLYSSLIISINFKYLFLILVFFIFSSLFFNWFLSIVNDFLCLWYL